MRRLLLACFTACLVLTVLLVAGIVTGALLSIWNDEPKWGMTAFVFAFLAIGTGGSAGFISSALKYDYPQRSPR